MAVAAIIASGKGGTGKSTVTALLGEALAFSGKRVLAVELDSGLRALDTALGLEKDIVFDLGDLMRGSANAKDAVYRCGFCPNLSLIAASAHPSELPEGLLTGLAKTLGGDYDFILFDCPTGLGGTLEIAARETDLALIVAAPDAVSVKAARSAVQTVRSSGRGSVRLIINRVPPKARLLAPLASLDEVIDGTGAQLLGALWDDRDTRDALAFGRPLSRASKNAAPFSNIAKRLCGEQAPLSIK